MNSKFSFSKTFYQPRQKKNNPQPTLLLTNIKRRVNGFTFFSGEMPTASFRIWTLVADSISYAVYRCTKQIATKRINIRFDQSLWLVDSGYSNDSLLAKLNINISPSSNTKTSDLVWLGFIAYQPFGLFNAKSYLYLYIKYIYNL